MTSKKQEAEKACSRCGAFLETQFWEVDGQTICEICTSTYVKTIKKLEVSSLLFSPVFSVFPLVLSVFLSQWLRSEISSECNSEILWVLWLLTAPFSPIPVYFSEKNKKLTEYYSGEIPEPSELNRGVRLEDYKRALIMPVNIANASVAFAMLFPLLSFVPIHW